MCSNSDLKSRRSCGLSVRSRNFVSDKLAFAEDPKTGRQSFAAVSFADDRRRKRMKTRLAIAPKIANGRHHERKQRRQKFLQIIADKEIFLPRFADDRRRIDRVLAMKNRVGVERPDNRASANNSRNDRRTALRAFARAARTLPQIANSASAIRR